MSDQKQNAQPSGLNLGDIYFVLFRRKWIIISFILLAVVLGAAVYILKPPRFHSEAEFFIRYVVEVKTPRPTGDDSDTRSLDDQTASILETEMQIMRSLDVAREAAEKVGPERILAQMGGGASRDAAANVILNYLTIQPPLRGTVIFASFEHPNPEIAQETLHEVIVAYVNKHKELRQPVGIFGDFMDKETERIRDQLNDTEQQLKAAKNRAGVVSLDEAKKAFVEQRTKTRQDLFDAEAELAQHQAILGEVTNLISTTATETTNAQPEIPLDQLTEYKNICSRINSLSQKEQELLTQFTEDSQPVKEIRQRLDDVRQLRRNLEQAYPKLLSLNLPSSTVSGQSGIAPTDPVAEAIQIRALKSRIAVLNSQLNQLQAEAGRLSEAEDTIHDLERKKDLLDADLKYYEASRNRSRVEEALGAGKAPNIGIIQDATPPHKAWSKQFKKKFLMLTVGCVAFGFALAFGIELFVDRSVKRASEVTNKLRLPLFISIPDLARTNGHHSPAHTPGPEPLLLNDGEATEADTGSSMPVATLPMTSPGRNDPLRRYYEGLRDRLIVYFDVKNITQKPKLVAVTSCNKGAGVTSIAAGLAASLSEIGDGNVLLVDMNGEQGASQSFYRGKPACPLDDALASETKESAMVQSNLYVASELPQNDKFPRALPGRFASLMPKLKASDYDYIIFDMPPVSQTSMTLRAARIMDTVLLVIEAEKTNQDVVKQAVALLAEAKVNVNTVLNKTRNYVPSALQPELSNDP
jgi:uncharacterized protein involved in exopolysaccharide biosynthesis/Mrp family chromosome partitioning ATPase